MVWGGISSHGKTDLVIIDGNLNARRYVYEVLDSVVVPFTQRIGAGFILQHDNARPHTARHTQNFLAGQAVKALPWPSCSPDFNP